MPMMRFCKDCNQEKDSSLFAFVSSRTGQLRPQCKPCTNVREFSRLAARRAADGVKPDSRCCSKCNKTKPLTSEFFKTGIRFKHGLSTECSECLCNRNLEWSRTEAGKSLRNRLKPRYKDYRSAYAQAYQKAHKEQFAKHSKVWRERNLERARELARNYSRNNLAYRTEQRHQRRAAGEFSYSVVPELMKSQGGKCTVCRGFLTKFVEIDHIFPIALGGTNEKSNLQLLCRPCNRSKGAKHPVDFMQSRGFLL